MAKLKVKVIEVSPQEDGTFTNKLQHRTEDVIKDPVLGEVVKVNSEWYYVKTTKGLKVDVELELDMNNYDVEKSEFKNSDEQSLYYGETMNANWLVPKSSK